MLSGGVKCRAYWDIRNALSKLVTLNLGSVILNIHSAYSKKALCFFHCIFFSFQTYQNHILQCAQDRAILKMKVELKTDSSDKFVWGFLLLNHFFFSVLKIRVRCYEKSFWIYFLFSGLRGANVSWLWINFHIMFFFQVSHFTDGYLRHWEFQFLGNMQQVCLELCASPHVMAAHPLQFSQNTSLELKWWDELLWVK